MINKKTLVLIEFGDCSFDPWRVKNIKEKVKKFKPNIHTHANKLKSNVKNWKHWWWQIATFDNVELWLLLCCHGIIKCIQKSLKVRWKYTAMDRMVCSNPKLIFKLIKKLNAVVVHFKTVVWLFILALLIHL